MPGINYTSVTDNLGELVTLCRSDESILHPEILSQIIPLDFNQLFGSEITLSQLEIQIIKGGLSMLTPDVLNKIPEYIEQHYQVALRHYNTQKQWLGEPFDFAVGEGLTLNNYKQRIFFCLLLSRECALSFKDTLSFAINELKMELDQIAEYAFQMREYPMFFEIYDSLLKTNGSSWYGVLNLETPDRKLPLEGIQEHKVKYLCDWIASKTPIIDDAMEKPILKFKDLPHCVKMCFSILKGLTNNKKNVPEILALFQTPSIIALFKKFDLNNDALKFFIRNKSVELIHDFLSDSSRLRDAKTNAQYITDLAETIELAPNEALLFIQATFSNPSDRKRLLPDDDTLLKLQSILKKINKSYPELHLIEYDEEMKTPDNRSELDALRDLSTESKEPASSFDPNEMSREVGSDPRVTISEAKSVDVLDEPKSLALQVIIPLIINCKTTAELFEKLDNNHLLETNAKRIPDDPRINHDLITRITMFSHGLRQDATLKQEAIRQICSAINTKLLQLDLSECQRIPELIDLVRNQKNDASTIVELKSKTDLTEHHIENIQNKIMAKYKATSFNTDHNKQLVKNAYASTHNAGFYFEFYEKYGFDKFLQERIDDLEQGSQPKL